MERRIRLFGLIVLVTAALSGPGPGVPAARADGFYFQVHGGISTISLDDVNDAVDAVNEAGGAAVLDHFNSGPEAGVTIGYALTRNLNLGLGYARLWAATEYAEGSSRVEFDMPAGFYELTLDYLPGDDRRVRVGAGCDVGAVGTGAVWSLNDPDVDDVHLDFDGLGFLFAGYGIVDAALADHWSLYAQGGFRHANIGEVKVDGQTIFNPDSLDDKLRFNYSGVFLRVGVTFRP